MAGLARQLRCYTVRDYLEIDTGERPSKFELFKGQIYAMAGGTPDHALLSANIIIQVGSQLSNSLFSSYTEALRIGHDSDRLPGHRPDNEDKPFRAYPDASVVCGKRKLLEDGTVSNPKVLFEVTSPFTEDYDWGLKAREYQRIPSVESVVLISHREQRVTVLSRTGGWKPREFTTGVVEIPGIAASVDVEVLYSGVELDS